MGDVKEFTNEERSLLKFQKKQQHGQVLLLLLLLLVYSYSCGSVVLFLFVEALSLTTVNWRSIG